MIIQMLSVNSTITWIECGQAMVHGDYSIICMFVVSFQKETLTLNVLIGHRLDFTLTFSG